MQTDEQLVEAYRAGDRAAFDELVHRHLPSVYRFAYSYCRNNDDAQDAAQDAFVKAWRALSRFDTRKRFRPWLLAIARNSSLDIIKRRRAVPFSALADDGEDFAQTLADAQEPADETLERLLAHERAQAAIADLPPLQQQALSLRHDEELTFEEIAQVLKEPMNTVKSRYRRAILVLQKRLGAEPAGAPEQR
jgi:RNA polymerase sigma-70 factor (ECF subfamily)